jgi:hypothetical protein
MIPVCIKGSSKNGRSAGALTWSVTTISSSETAIVATEPSRNRALHDAPAANGRLVAAVTRTNWEGGGAAAVEDRKSVEAGVDEAGKKSKG